MAQFILLVIALIFLFVGAFKLEEDIMSLIGGKGILEVISDWFDKRGK